MGGSPVRIEVSTRRVVRSLAVVSCAAERRADARALAARDPGRGAHGAQPQVGHVRRRVRAPRRSALVPHRHARAQQGPRPLRAAQVPALLALRRPHREYARLTRLPHSRFIIFK